MESELSTRPSQRDKYTIIIPAAGIGRRMKIYGPKSLIKINKKHTILSNQIELIKSTFRHFEIIIVGGFQHEKIFDSLKIKCKFVINNNYEDTNVFHSISLGLNKTSNNKVLIVYGDLIFNKACINLPFNKESSIVVSDTMKNEEVGCIFYDGILENVFYKLPNKWAQIIYFTGPELEQLRSLASNNNYCNWFGFEAINNIVNTGGIFNVLTPTNARAIDIDSSYDLKLIEKI